MSRDRKPIRTWDDEDEFLIPPGQTGSMMDRLAAEQAGFSQPTGEHVVVLPPGRFHVIVIGDVAAVEIVWGAGA